MDYNELCGLERQVREAALLRQILDDRNDRSEVYVKVGYVNGSSSVTLLRSLDGIFDGIEEYLKEVHTAIKEKGYTGDLSEVVLG
jgi:hypothetical protein